MNSLARSFTSKKLLPEADTPEKGPISFSDELKAAKNATNYLFHQNLIPFDISNIPAPQFRQLKEYFQNQMLGKVIKKKLSRGSQTEGTLIK